MSLINEALKRASEAQNQAQARPRGPKGVEDLPVPMMPARSHERPSWLPVAGVALLIVGLLGASGFFFAQWWKERKAWQPYATEDVDEDGQPITNLVAKAEPPKVTPPVPAKVPVTTAPTPTNSPVPPPTPPPELPKTNPPLVAGGVPPPVTPPIFIQPAPPPAKFVTANPNITSPVPSPVPSPQVDPVTKAVTTNAPPPPTPPTSPKFVAAPSGEFPDLKLQGISRGKKKTFVTINGKTLSLGERIEGVTLLKIDADSVTVEKDGAKRELFLLR